MSPDGIEARQTEFVPVSVGLTMDIFPFHKLEEAFTTGIIVRLLFFEK